MINIFEMKDLWHRILHKGGHAPAHAGDGHGGQGEVTTGHGEALGSPAADGEA
jgi:hypothetical protein